MGFSRLEASVLVEREGAVFFYFWNSAMAVALWLSTVGQFLLIGQVIRFVLFRVAGPSLLLGQ